MGFIKYGAQGYLVDSKGKPMYVVGINYVASHICTNFFEDWRPEVMEKDLKRISELGLNAVRFPIIWGYFEPEEGKYNPLVIERFTKFIGLCKKYGIYAMPWFLAGVATRNYDVPFRNGRPFFEGHMVNVAENHLKNFVKHFKDEEQILFWDICDEPEFMDSHYGAAKIPYDPEVMARWFKAMYDAIKSEDQNHLVTIGVGHVASENYGIDLRDLAKIMDVLVLTGYPYGQVNEATDSLRLNYFMPFYARFHDNYGKPVYTCEAPGFSSVVYSEEVLRRYFKVVLYSNLINGSTGVMPWVFSDFDQNIWHQIPLENDTFEPYFGIVATDGRVKPSGKVLSEFAKFVNDNEITRYSCNKAEVAILLPKGYYTEMTGTFRKIYTTFMMVKGVSTDIDFVWDDPGS